MKTPNPDTWSDLPPDLLISIFERLSFSDFHRAKFVCSNWNSSSKQTVPQQNRSPWLMLFPDGDYGCVLYNPDEDRIYKSVRDFSGTIFLANSGNWFLVMDSKSNLYIIDVFSENRIDLPPLESFQSDNFTLERLGDKKFKLQVTDHHDGPVFYTIGKVLRGLLWVDEKTKEFVVVWFFDYNCKFLAYCKKGGDHYSNIDILCYFLPKEYRGVSDMVLHGYFLYIATPRGYIRFLDLSKQQGFEEVTGIYPLKSFNPSYYKTNCSIVVTTAGEVLMFQNNLDKKNIEGDKSFRLYKHGPNEINYYDDPLVEVDSLGDEEALLLDLGITMPGIEPNSIYFTRQDRVLHRQDINLHICVQSRNQDPQTRPSSLQHEAHGCSMVSPWDLKITNFSFISFGSDYKL